MFTPICFTACINLLNNDTVCEMDRKPLEPWRINHFLSPPPPKLTRSADAMEIRLPEFGKIKVDHHIHSLNVNSSRKQIWIVKRRVM